jgi:serine protease DegQ
VLAVDGTPVRSSTDLRNRIGLVEVDRSVALEIQRDGRRDRLDVKVSPMAERKVEAGAIVPQLAGAGLSEIPPDHPAYRRVVGILVTEVARNSPAARVGLRRGDIILAVNGQLVASPDQLREAAPRRGERLMLNLLRGNREFLVSVG